MAKEAEKAITIGKAREIKAKVKAMTRKEELQPGQGKAHRGKVKVKAKAMMAKASKESTKGAAKAAATSMVTAMHA